MMHTEYDTQTVTNTLAFYGVHRPAYYRVRSTVRFLAYMALALAAFVGPHALVSALTH